MGKADKSATMNRMHAAARLARTTLAARLATHGFYAGQDQIMLALDRQDGQTPGQLAALLGVRPPTITKTINRLQAQGFLEKKSSETDARQANVSLTTQGREMIKAIERCVKKTEKSAFRGFDKKDQRTLIKLLSRIEANLSDTPVVELPDAEDDDE